MPTLHVVDPKLRGNGGHYLSQHTALLHLCRKQGYAMVSYCHRDFDPAAMPQGVAVTPLFGLADIPRLSGHYTLDLANTNQEAHDGLSRLDPALFEPDDLVFLTSVTADTVVAYGHWLKTVGPAIPCPIGIYCIISSELEDTLGRHVRRHGMVVDDQSFQSLDNVVVPNEVKRSLYRSLFSSLSDDVRKRAVVFYEEPFPTRTFLDLGGEDLRFVHLHSMYSGGEPETAPRSGAAGAHISFLGSGGIGNREKGGHMVPDIVAALSSRRRDLRFSLQFGHHADAVLEAELRQVAAHLEEHDRVRLYYGSLDCATFCSVLEGADVVVQPYGKGYRHFMSGLFDDCLFLGKVAVIPRYSKMARWMEHHSLDAPLFDEQEPAAIVAAVEDALDRFEFYQEQFLEARRITRAAWARNNPVTALNKMRAKQS